MGKNKLVGEMALPEEDGGSHPSATPVIGTRGTQTFNHKYDK